MNKYYQRIIFTFLSVLFTCTCFTACLPSTRMSEQTATEELPVPSIMPPIPIGGWKAIGANVIYPDSARTAHIEGTVKVEAFIDSTGTATKFVVMQGLPKSGLDEAAIEAIKKTPWKAARVRGRPVGLWISIPVTFLLKGPPPLPKNGPDTRFIPYDEAPRPIGGYRAIQRRVRYPLFAQETGIQGTVIVMAFIDSTGRVTETIVHKGIPNTGLDESAMNAIRKTLFKPAKLRGRPVGVWIAVPIRFRLKLPSRPR